MNLQTNENLPTEIALPISLAKQNDYGFSKFDFLLTLVSTVFVILIVNLWSMFSYSATSLFKLSFLFLVLFDVCWIHFVIVNGVLLLGMGLAKLIKKPIGLIVFQLFCSIVIFGLYYSRVLDDYFMDSQYIIAVVVVGAAALVYSKLIKNQFDTFLKPWFLIITVISLAFMTYLFFNPTQTPAILRVFEYNRSAQNKIDMRRIVPESEFLNFDIVYTEAREQEKFMYADFKADLKQNNVDRYAIWATAEVLIQRKVDTQGRETMGNKVQLMPTVIAYYNCSCSSSDCSNRKAKGQIKGESDQYCDISWRNGIYRLNVKTTDATLDEFIQMAKIIAKNSEYLK